MMAPIGQEQPSTLDLSVHIATDRQRLTQSSLSHAIKSHFLTTDFKRSVLMLREDGHDPEDCRALSEVLSRIGDRWTILVVGILAGGPQRFNEMRRSIEGITQRMLTLTLRGLERDGLVVRTQTKTLPPSVEYVLSDRGTTLLVPLLMLAKWGREHRPGIVESRIAFDLARSAESGDQEKSKIYRLSSRL